MAEVSPLDAATLRVAKAKHRLTGAEKALNDSLEKPWALKKYRRFQAAELELEQAIAERARLREEASCEALESTL